MTYNYHPYHDDELLIYISLQNNRYYSSNRAILNSTECFAQGLCPSQDPSKFSETLEHTKVFDVITIFSENLSIPLNESERFWKVTHQRDPDVYRPSYVHSLSFSKLAVVLVVYLALAIAFLALYRNRKRLAFEYDFKLSTLSKSIFKYMVVKVASTIAYFIFLFVFTNERVVFKLPYLIQFFAIWNYMLTVTSFVLVVLFALGYGTKRFTISTQMWVKTGILSAGFVNQTVYSLIQELDQLYTYWNRTISTYHKVSIGFLFVALVITTCYFAYSTYSIDKDDRFSTSAQVILAAFLLNPFITIPTEPVSDVFLVKIVGTQYDDEYVGGQHVPEILELVALASLVYIWRDIAEEEELGVALDSVSVDSV